MDGTFRGAGEQPTQSERELAELIGHYLNLTESPLPPRSKVYSAPRRFDLATIFVVTAAYSALLAAMSPLRSPISSIIVAGFITLVGISQALLFKGRRPRMASMLVGATIFSLAVGASWLVSGPRLYPDTLMVLAGIATIAGGAFLGYFAGACVGSVFLLADVVRGRFGRGELGEPAKEL